jgi:Bacterial PH domain
MSYIRKVIGQNERLMVVTGLHWIYIVGSLFWGGLIAALGFAAEYYLSPLAHYESINENYFVKMHYIDPLYIRPAFITSLTGFAIFLILFTKYLSTEIGLTDRRIIHKRGVIKIDVQQVELEDIRGEHVKHGWLGWLFGYGRIHFDCRFIDDILLPAIRDPYRLVKSVHTARMRSESIPHYGPADLELDVTRIDEQRIAAFKMREKLKRLALLTKRDFDKAKKT